MFLGSMLIAYYGVGLPLVVGIGMWVAPGRPERRGVGMGLVLGVSLTVLGVLIL